MIDDSWYLGECALHVHTSRIERYRLTKSGSAWPPCSFTIIKFISEMKITLWSIAYSEILSISLRIIYIQVDFCTVLLWSNCIMACGWPPGHYAFFISAPLYKHCSIPGSVHLEIYTFRYYTTTTFWLHIGNCWHKQWLIILVQQEDCSTNSSFTHLDHSFAKRFLT